MVGEEVKRNIETLSKGLDWNQFPEETFTSLPKDDYIKPFPFEDAKWYVMGFSRRSIDLVNFDEGKGTKPTLRLFVDRVDNDPPLGHLDYAISTRSKNFINAAKMYEDKGTLYTHLFKVRRYKDKYEAKDGSMQDVTVFDIVEYSKR